MKGTLFFCLSLSAMLLFSCGKGNIIVKLKEENIPRFDQSNRFRMSTQESAINKYPTVEEVDLYQLVPHLDSLAIEYDSFMEIYRVLELKGKIIQSKFVILKKDPNCTSSIGYCRAVFLKR